MLSPDSQGHPVSEVGDLWLLGRHRLLCGDCTVATDVERVLAGVTPHLMVTDPPYGVNYDPAWRERSLDSWKKPRSMGTVENDDRADWREAWALFPGDVAYVWHAGTKAAIVQESLEACDLLVRTQIIWAKQHFAIGRGHYHADCLGRDRIGLELSSGYAAMARRRTGFAAPRSRRAS